MAEEISIPDPIIFDLPIMGKQAVTCIDLYDEGRFGADELAQRGRFYVASEVGEAITKVLASGSPIQDPADIDNKLAFNRFNSPKAKWYRASEYTDPYKNRAAHLVYFRVRVHFRQSVATIGFGIRWKNYRNADGELNERFPLGNYELNQPITIDDLRIIDVTGITVEDAHDLLLALGVTNPVDLEIEDLENVELNDDTFAYLYRYDVPKGETIASVGDGDDVLIVDNSILTIE